MISTQFTGYVKRIGNEDANVAVQVTLSYDAGTDPLAVQVIFEIPDEDDRVWHLGRDLLLEGSVSPVPVGEGDVKFRYFGPMTGCLMMCLKSPEGHADIALPQQEVAKFLDDTKELADQAGGEELDSLVDLFLKEVFEA